MVENNPMKETGRTNGFIVVDRAPVDARLEVDSKIRLKGVQQAAAQPPMMMTQSNYK